MTEPATLGEAIERHARSRPDAPALVATGCAPLSYRELGVYMACASARLRQGGLARDARIAIALPSGANAAIAIVAAACHATAAPLDTQLTGPEIETRLKALRPSAIIAPAQSRSPAREIAAARGIAVIEAHSEAGKLGVEWDAGAVAAAAADPPDAASIAFILQTSGTTAAPKLIPFSHGAMLAAAARVRSWFALTPADRCLSVSPVHYAHGLHVTVFAPLVSGGSIAFPRSPTALDVDEWLADLAPTWYSAGPTLHRFVLDKATAAPDVNSRHRLRFILSGGAPLAAYLRERLSAALGVPVLDHYGSSEAAQICANQLPPGPARAGTCGVPPHGAVRIVADDGAPVPAGGVGEIYLCGPSVISGYLDAPELNQKSFVGGWFRSGDLGSLDRDGFLTLHGRKTELINRGGEKISPAEIDEALERHPLVAEAASFALPHARLGEEAAAAVVLKPGAAPTPSHLREFLRPALAAFKIPRRIFFVQSLPKGPSGKVLRQRLTEQFR